ncbi:MAG TPA: S-layer homology domain-containing protein [Acidimicrobiales bacterium]|nr:S-layer homology domain-containing protein [Acidimicrobiales bacterium]
MASTTADHFGMPRVSTISGALVLAACLFVTTLCLGFSVLWLVDSSMEPGWWLVGLPAAAFVALGVSAFADNTWSARATRTTELGNTTRLFALVSVLLLAPTALMQLVAAEDEVHPRGIDGACPSERLPDHGYDDLAPGSAQEQAVRCLSWWGVVTAEGGTYGGEAQVTREQMASFLDRVLAAAGHDLPVARARFDDTEGSVHQPAIARVAAAGLMGDPDGGTFSPVATVSRAEVSSLVARAHTALTGEELPAPVGRPFLDLRDHPHADNVEAVALAGIAAGSGATFRPDVPVDRAQLAVILARTLDLWVEQGAAELPDQASRSAMRRTPSARSSSPKANDSRA